MSARLIAVAGALLLALAACGEEAAPGDDAAAGDAAGDAAAGDAAAGDAAAGDADVTLAATDLGDVLAGPDGATLYLFENDGGGPDSTCYEQCAENWPPLLVEGAPVAGDGVDGGLLGTTERDDGSLQVTYGGHPLYYFGGDGGPGDVAGQGVADVWWVVSPAGEALRATAEGDSGYADY